MAQLKLTLKRSLIGSTQRQRANVEALGLKGRNDTKIVDDKPEIRGMIDKVQHLLDIQDV